MNSKNRDVSECPEGYRRYVYRVNLNVPFKQEVEPLFENIPETEEEAEELLKDVNIAISELEKKRQFLKELLEKMKQ